MSIAGLTGTAETFQLNSPTINTNGGPVTLNGNVNLGYAPQILGDGPSPTGGWARPAPAARPATWAPPARWPTGPTPAAW